MKAAPADSEADARQRAETGGGVLQYLQLGESALLPAAELCGWKGGGGYGVGTAGGGGQQRISLANMKLCMEVRGADMQLCWEVRARVRLCTMRSSPCAIHLPTHVVCTHQHGHTAPRLSRFTVAVPAEQLYRCWPQCGMYTRGLPRTDTHAAQCNATWNLLPARLTAPPAQDTMILLALLPQNAWLRQLDLRGNWLGADYAAALQGMCTERNVALKLGTFS